jgi:BON domain-containing protein
MRDDLYDDADFSGPYARDTHRGGYGDDYAREAPWGGSGARGDAYGRTRQGRGMPYVGYGQAQARSIFGGNGAFRHRGRGPKNYRRSDERIWEEVNERLTADDDVDATEIDVNVENGVVTLSGFVHSRYEKRRAEDVAERVGGVDDVMNALRVASSDREIEIGNASE